MKHRVSILSAILVAGAAIGGYTATVATRSASQPAASSDDATGALLSWLSGSADQNRQLGKADPGFADELQRLKTDVADRRADLASLLDKPEATNEQIMAGLEQVIAANNALERRVAKYLLAVREHLTAEQQRRLLNLCAEEVRRGRGYQWGRQQGSRGSDSQPGRGGHGRGPGPGGPPGRNRGN